MESVGQHSDSSHHDSLSSVDSFSSEESAEKTLETEREDHVKLVHEMAKNESRAANLWLFGVIAGLLITGIVLTIIAFTTLENEENNDFKAAVS